MPGKKKMDQSLHYLFKEGLLKKEVKTKKKEKKRKTKEIRTIMADCMNCENVTVTATFHYVCLWVMINRRFTIITSREGFTL